MRGLLHLQTQHPPSTSGLPPAGKSCWSVDVRVVVILVTLAGALILLLLYRLLQQRHRLRLARARHALEYNSFYHSTTYTLKHPAFLPHEELPVKNGTVAGTAPTLQTVAKVMPVVIAPLPPPPVVPPAPLPLPQPPVLAPPPLTFTPSLLATPFSLPVIHATPPSPHLSWGACSDDVYSRIGAFRPSRLSSLSSQSKVILFEHSSL